MALIRVMWLYLRPPEQCVFNSHQVPSFSGVGIRKYTFFPAKYRPYAFLYGIYAVFVWHIRVVTTWWVQIPPGANFFRCRYKKIHLFFRQNIDHMRFCYALIRVMWLHLRPPEQCGFKSHQVPTFSGVGIRKYTFFRPNIDHMRFCYGLIRVMWLHLRPPEQCGFKSHQVPTFSGVGIRKYTFFRPNIAICLFATLLISSIFIPSSVWNIPQLNNASISQQPSVQSCFSRPLQ